MKSSTPVHVSLVEDLAKGPPPPGNLAVPIFSHGSLVGRNKAGSGAFLLKAFGDAAGFVPVVRRLEAKFRKPASGQMSARATVASDQVARWAVELAERGRVVAAEPVEVVDQVGTVVLSATIEWFIARDNAN